MGTGDYLWYSENFIGPAIGLLALLWAVLTILTNLALRRDRRALLAAGSALGLAGLLADMPSLLAEVLFAFALTLAVLLPRTARFDDAWRWTGRLLTAWLMAPTGPISDLGCWRRVRRLRMRPHTRQLAPMLVVPIAGTLVFTILFGIANPMIGAAFDRLQLPPFSFETLGRVFWWGVILIMVWGTLRPRRIRHAPPRPPLDPAMVLPGLSTASVTLALALFNTVFAVENVLDLAFLWSGAALPKGISYASYAHQGAYPLIATALLAAVFVLVALRPGSVTAANRSIRVLVTLWVGQNLFLVASSVLRTCAYIDTYSLTPLRLAALVWMLLVAGGLVLIIWRLLRAKSTAWLINTNSAVALLMLTVSAVVDFGAVSASWNVNHARETGGHGAALDLCHLHRLGSAALVPLTELAQRTPRSPFGERVRWVRARVLDATAIEQSGGDWSWRNARRLAAAQRLPVFTPVDTPLPNGIFRTCDGALYTVAPPQRAVAEPLPTPLTPGPAR